MRVTHAWEIKEVLLSCAHCEIRRMQNGKLKISKKFCGKIFGRRLRLSGCSRGGERRRKYCAHAKQGFPHSTHVAWSCIWFPFPVRLEFSFSPILLSRFEHFLRFPEYIITFIAWAGSEEGGKEQASNLRRGKEIQVTSFLSFPGRIYLFFWNVIVF